MIASAVFLLSGAFVLYVLAGYPLLLAILSRRPRPVRSAPMEPSVTVLLPVYNGERWIAQKIRTLMALDYPRAKLQVVILSDGSTDGTVELARRFTDQGIEIVDLPHGGKAAALNAGLKLARGEVLFLTDVRQPLDPQCLRHLTACLADPEVGAASGELVILKGENLEQANVGLYWKYEKWLRKRMSAIDSFLGATGAIYAIRRNLAASLPPGTLLDDVYLPLLAFFQGFRVVFEPKALAYDYPTSLNTEFRRKVRTQGGVYQLMRFFPALLGPRNRMWLHFVSHKLGRLWLPYALIAMAVSSFWLPAPWRHAALLLQGCFYALALSDRFVSERTFLKKLTSPAWTFTVLMTAALCGTTILFRGGGSLWTSRAE